MQCLQCNNGNIQITEVARDELSVADEAGNKSERVTYQCSEGHIFYEVENTVGYTGPTLLQE